MTPHQIRSVRQMRGINMEDWARLLGISIKRLRYLEEPERSVITYGTNPKLQAIPKWLPFTYGWIVHMGLKIHPDFDPIKAFTEWRHAEGAKFTEAGLLLNESTATLWNWNTGRTRYPGWFPYAVAWIQYYGALNPFAALTPAEQEWAS